MNQLLKCYVKRTTRRRVHKSKHTWGWSNR